jgi:hypothetical protein
MVKAPVELSPMCVLPSESQTIDDCTVIDAVGVTVSVVVGVTVGDDAESARGEKISIYKIGVKYPKKLFLDFESALFLVKFNFFNSFLQISSYIIGI